MNMGNRKAREFAKQQAEEASRRADEALWERILTQPREYHSDFHLRGLGWRRTQLVEIPCFDVGAVFDLRQSDDDWRLYQSKFVPETDQVIGYEQLAFDSGKLKGMFARVTSLTLPLIPFLNGYGGADGEVYELAVFGDLYSEWRFRWWTDSPPQWKPLVDLATEMLEAFWAAPRVPAWR